jgi:hypothetical protein
VTINDIDAQKAGDTEVARMIDPDERDGLESRLAHLTAQAWRLTRLLDSVKERNVEQDLTLELALLNRVVTRLETQLRELITYAEQLVGETHMQSVNSGSLRPEDSVPVKPLPDSKVNDAVKALPVIAIHFDYFDIL